MLSVPGRRSRTHRRARTAIVAGVLACLAVVGAASAAVSGFNPFGDEKVGQTYAGAVLLPTNQWISPAGTRILDSNERLVSSTLSPDGTYLAALGWNNFSGYVTIINLKTHADRPAHAAGDRQRTSQDYSVAADGPLYSRDGKTLWVPQSTYLARFSVDPTTGKSRRPQQSRCAARL